MDRSVRSAFRTELFFFPGSKEILDLTRLPNVE